MGLTASETQQIRRHLGPSRVGLCPAVVRVYECRNPVRAVDVRPAGARTHDAAWEYTRVWGVAVVLWDRTSDRRSLCVLEPQSLECVFFHELYVNMPFVPAGEHFYTFESDQSLLGGQASGAVSVFGLSFEDAGDAFAFWQQVQRVKPHTVEHSTASAATTAAAAVVSPPRRRGSASGSCARRGAGAPPQHSSVRSLRETHSSHSLSDSLESLDCVLEEEDLVLGHRPLPAVPEDDGALVGEAALVARGVVRAQALVRGFLARRVAAHLRKEAAYRRSVAMEIGNSERAYLQSLQVLVKHFLDPLRTTRDKQGRAILSEDARRRIFSDVEVIHSYNMCLLVELDERLDAWSVHQRIGDAFVSLGSYLKLYTSYVQNYSHALVEMSKQAKGNERFRKFVREAEQHEACGGLTLDAFLIMPIQRIPRYRLLLSDLLKHTDAEHPDYADLEAGLAKILEVATYVNERKREAENLRRIIDVQQHISGMDEDLAQPHRRLVREGHLCEFRRTLLAGNTLRSVDRYVFVMSDAMVVCNVKNEKKATYKFKYTLAWGDTKMVSSGQSIGGAATGQGLVRTGPFDTVDDDASFEVTTNDDTSHVFVATSPAERDEWVNEIVDLISHRKDKRNEVQDKLWEASQQKIQLFKALTNRKYTLHGDEAQVQQVFSTHSLRLQRTRKNIQSRRLVAIRRSSAQLQKEEVDVGEGGGGGSSTRSVRREGAGEAVPKPGKPRGRFATMSGAIGRMSRRMNK